MSKTIKVRIPVVVSPEGEWYGEGGDHTDEEDGERARRIFFHGRGHLVWIEADLPLPPAAPVVQGVVVDGADNGGA